MISYDKDSHLPIGKQLFNNIKRLIIIGAIKENDLLPSVRAVATEQMVNPNTVYKVYQELEQTGLVTIVPQKGIYANKVPTDILEEYQKSLEGTFVDTYHNLLDLSLDEKYIKSLLD